jgi:cysteine protease ATG4
MDGFVSTAQLEEACAHPDGWRPLLLLLPLRLGLDRFHAPYAAALAQLLALRACVGMVGGRPRRSFYFAGVQGAPDATTPPPPPPRAPPPKPPAALYWDPHTAQPALGTDGERGGAPRWPLSAADVASCHCAGLRQMRLADLDPSLALGFLCATKAELREWAAAAAAICASAEPLFAVQAHPLARAATRRPAEGAEVEGADDGGGRAAHDQAAPADGGGGYDDDEDDDLVIV